MSTTTNHFNQLSESEAERLSILMEECAEVIQIIGKIQRHGLHSTHPNGGPTNRMLLEKEIGHVYNAVDMLSLEDISYAGLMASCHAKADSIKPYLHHQQ